MITRHSALPCLHSPEMRKTIASVTPVTTATALTIVAIKSFVFFILSSETEKVSIYSSTKIYICKETFFIKR